MPANLPSKLLHFHSWLCSPFVRFFCAVSSPQEVAGLGLSRSCVISDSQTPCADHSRSCTDYKSSETLREPIRIYDHPKIHHAPVPNTSQNSRHPSVSVKSSKNNRTSATLTILPTEDKKIKGSNGRTCACNDLREVGYAFVSGFCAF
jgi:hypothetical protein